MLERLIIEPLDSWKTPGPDNPYLARIEISARSSGPHRNRFQTTLDAETSRRILALCEDLLKEGASDAVADFVQQATAVTAPAERAQLPAE